MPGIPRSEALRGLTETLPAQRRHAHKRYGDGTRAAVLRGVRVQLLLHPLDLGKAAPTERLSAVITSARRSANGRRSIDSPRLITRHRPPGTGSAMPSFWSTPKARSATPRETPWSLISSAADGSSVISSSASICPRTTSAIFRKVPRGLDSCDTRTTSLRRSVSSLPCPFPLPSTAPGRLLLVEEGPLELRFQGQRGAACGCVGQITSFCPWCGCSSCCSRLRCSTRSDSTFSASRSRLACASLWLYGEIARS